MSTAPENRDRVRRLWVAGMSFGQIAEQMGLSRSAVAGHCRRAGLSRGKPRGEAWPLEKRDELRALFTAGLSDAEIAARLGRTKNAVHSQRHRMGLFRKPEPEVDRQAFNGTPGAVRKIYNGDPHDSPATKRLNRIVAGAAAVARAPSAPVVAIADSGGRRGLAALERGQCHFPLDDPGPGRMDETLFCAAPGRPGGVYCDGHAWLSLSVAARIAKAAAR